MEHRFVPDTYYMSIGSHDPVLRVGSGDLIHTVTVDAGDEILRETKLHLGEILRLVPFMLKVHYQAMYLPLPSTKFGRIAITVFVDPK